MALPYTTVVQMGLGGRLSGKILEEWGPADEYFGDLYKLGMWRMGELYGTTLKDSYRHGYDLALTSAFSLGQTGVLPEGGLGVSFSTGYASITDAELNVAVGTLFVLFKPSTTATAIQRIAGCGVESGTHGFMLYMDTSSLKFSVGTGAGAGIATSPTALVAGRWYLAVAYMTGAAVEFGVYDVTTAAAATTSVAVTGPIYSGTLDFRLANGSSYDAAKNFSGTIGFVCLAEQHAAIPGAYRNSLYAATQWTDTTVDVVTTPTPLSLSYGFQGQSPTDRCARTGICTFALSNSLSNSGGVVGYYSPSHASCRSGFTLGCAVRVGFTYSGTTYYKFRGAIRAIQPVPGIKRQRQTVVTATDWMETASNALLTGLSAQANIAAGDALRAAIGESLVAPVAVDIDSGDTFVFALDQGSDGRQELMAEMSRIAVSEYGQLFIKGDTTQGGTLTFENRATRQLATSVATFTNSMQEMDVSFDVADLFNVVRVSVTPRDVDDTAVVLYQLQGTQTLGAGQTVVIEGRYGDPSQRSAKVGGIEMVAPVATTDYLLNANADGLGVNLTASLVVSAELGASATRFTLTNTGTTFGYITLLQVRGKGLYAFEPITAEVTKDSSIALNGRRLVEFTMPYQSDLNVAQSVGAILLYIQSEVLPIVRRLSLWATQNTTLIAQMLAREVGDRIGVVETVTGVTTTVVGFPSDSRGFFIQSVALEVSSGGKMKCDWELAPSSSTGGFWLLGTSGRSELGDTTRLGF